MAGREETEADIVTAEDDGELDNLVVGAGKVVIAGALLLSVESSDGTESSILQNLKDIELTTAGRPARALGLSVLKSIDNLLVEEPKSRHVAVETTSTIAGHGELKDKDLVASSPSVVGLGSWTDVAAASIVAAGGAGNDKLGVGWDELVGENLRAAGRSLSIRRGIRKRRAEAADEVSTCLSKSW